MPIPDLEQLAAYSYGARLSGRLRSVSATTLADRAEGHLSIHGRHSHSLELYILRPPHYSFRPCANFGRASLTPLDHPRQPANIYLGGGAAEEEDSAPPREP